MATSPASGERAALRGYRWQYDHIAALVYDALVQDDFVSLRLTDPQAGKVDDLVLVTRSGVDGYQFKSSEFDGFVTFSHILAHQQTRSGTPAPSLIRALADGWTLLRRQHDVPVRVHLVAQLFASSHDHLADTTHRVSPNHFQAFIAQVLEPLRRGSLSLAEVPAGWEPAMVRLQDGTGLAAELFAEFAQAMHLDLGARDALPSTQSTRWSDIVALSNQLYRTVSHASGVVQLDRQQVLALMGWADRPRLRSSHDFPVDLDTYAPLEQAIAELDGQLACHTRGYIAIIGPPGAGKSTMLSQALTGRPERVVRYYAYVPGAAPARSRLTAQAFLHDLVVMLGRTGLGTAERHLVSPELDSLRSELHEQLDAALREFSETGRRTIIIVDGLDHVERDYPGNDGLLSELPSPSELPDGVLIIIGSRMLTPLNPRARQQIDEDGTVVNLEHNRLPTSAVLEICRHAPTTSDLGSDVHLRIAQLSSGHPLALCYLLNRLRDRNGSDDPKVILANAPAYAGDIAAEYRVVWDLVETSADVVSMLSVCARLRVGFTTEWLETWALPIAIATFRLNLRYLFRRHHDGWHFFHDSFRQFVTDRTALDDDGRFDPVRDATQHARVAELCSVSVDRLVAWEELYHRHRAGQHDAVIALGQQELFRDQACNLRSLESIRTDIGLVLRTYANQCDVPGLLTMLLAAMELGDRESVLEDVDLPGALYDAGLIDEAIGACGGDHSRQVRLAYAYRLAERLGRDGRPEGRRIFDLVEHDHFDDPERLQIAGREDEAAQAWGAAAPWFRPLSKILSATQVLLAPDSAQDQRDRFNEQHRRRRYTTIMQAVIDSLARQGRTDDLLAVDQALAGSLLAARTSRPQQAVGSSSSEAPGDDSREWADRVAALVALRVRLRLILVAQDRTVGDVQRHVDETIALLEGIPSFYSTLLDVAELAAQYGRESAAVTLLQDSPYINMLTVSDLSYSSEPDVLDRRFRYWRLRSLLVYRAGDTSAEDAAAVPASVPPNAATPAGNSIIADAAAHTDSDAIELAHRIDAAVRALAWLDASIVTQRVPAQAETWTKLLAVLEVFRPPARLRSSSSFHGMIQQRAPLMLLAVTAAVHYGARLPDRLAETLALRFARQPDSWPLFLRLELATELRRAGVTAPWYPDLLIAREHEASQTDVISRLQDLAGLIRCYADDGELAQAARLARALVPVTFGVGYRKDYQFSAWVEWLGRALKETRSTPMIAEAVWLARLLAAADPMTEGAPGSAAADLPAAAAAASSIGAVRLFEFLVRQGTVRHMNTLAGLVGALVAEQDAMGIRLAAEFTAEVIAPAANQAYPQLAHQIMKAAHRVLGVASAQDLAAQLASRTDRYALPTARAGWRQGLGLPHGDDVETAPADTSSSDEYGALLLNDGRRLARADVPAMAPDIRAMLALRQAEDPESTFQWSELIERMTLSAQDLTALEDAFQGSGRESATILTILAERAHATGDVARAAQLASLVLQRAPQDSWSSHWGSIRRRAHAIAIAAGGRQQQVAACQDLANQVIETSWLASSLVGELAEVVAALDPAVTAIATWPTVRQYLAGIAQTLILPQDDVLDDLAYRWWFPGLNRDQRARAPRDTAAAALAELAAGHLAHPTWVVRDGASRVVVRALKSGNVEVAEALARFAQPDTADDLLETAGRCLAAARQNPGYTTPPCLIALEGVLRNHPSQIMRDLAPVSGPHTYRALPGLYRLELPPRSGGPLVGQPRRFLAPHEDQYRMLAEGLGLNLDTVYAIADRYATQLLETLPHSKEVGVALTAANVKHTFPSNVILASRGAFGRVLADLTDVGLLSDIPTDIARTLRTVDLDLIDMSPQFRPAVLPRAPKAGHDQTTQAWLADVEDRLAEYIGHAQNETERLLGAKTKIAVLNWDHPEEEFSCGTLLADHSLTDEDPPFTPTYAWRLSDLTADTTATTELSTGEPLLLSNTGWTFHQLPADWISFRPDVAAALGWVPDPRTPGCWLTATGEPAVNTVCWVDGWWGRRGPAFDDSESEGWAVTISQVGLAQLIAQFGTMIRVLHLSRWGRHDGEESERVHASRQDKLTGGTR